MHLLPGCEPILITAPRTVLTYCPIGNVSLFLMFYAKPNKTTYVCVNFFQSKWSCLHFCLHMSKISERERVRLCVCSYSWLDPNLHFYSISCIILVTVADGLHIEPKPFFSYHCVVCRTEMFSKVVFPLFFPHVAGERCVHQGFGKVHDADYLSGSGRDETKEHRGHQVSV